MKLINSSSLHVASIVRKPQPTVLFELHFSYHGMFVFCVVHYKVSVAYVLDDKFAQLHSKLGKQTEVLFFGEPAKQAVHPSPTFKLACA